MPYLVSLGRFMAGGNERGGDWGGMGRAEVEMMNGKGEWGCSALVVGDRCPWCWTRIGLAKITRSVTITIVNEKKINLIAYDRIIF